MSFICVLWQPKFVYGVYRYIHINLKQIPYHSSFTGYLEISAALIWLTVVSSSFSASFCSSFTLLFAFFFNSFHRTFLHPPKNLCHCQLSICLLASMLSPPRTIPFHCHPSLIYCSKSHFVQFPHDWFRKFSPQVPPDEAAGSGSSTEQPLHIPFSCWLVSTLVMPSAL